MSMETATKFLTAMQRNGSFEKVCGMDGASVVSFAADKGYQVSLNDLKSAMRELNSDNLSEDELAAVAGGGGNVTVGGGGYPTTWDPNPGNAELDPTASAPNPNRPGTSRTGI